MEITESVRKIFQEMIVPELGKIREENQKIIAILELTNKRLDDVNTHLADQSRRIDDTNKRIDELRSELTERIESVRSELTERMDAVRTELTEKSKKSIPTGPSPGCQQRTNRPFLSHRCNQRSAVWDGASIDHLERQMGEIRQRLAA